MKKKSIGHDMTFNAPISVSLIYANATDDERVAILAAYRRAVGELSKIVSDGMGTFTNDLRPIDIVIEAGTKFAPFQELSPSEVKKSFGRTGSGMTRHRR